jgi:hypothetical protein
MSQFEKAIKIKHASFVILFDASNPIFDNDGIGAYECNGYRGYDKGNDFISEFEVSDLQAYSDRQDKYVTPSPKLKELILDHLLGETELFDEIAEVLMEQANERAYYRD